jgi:hypothetical protein
MEKREAAMARKKLSDAQRAAIKKEILKKLRAGDSRTSVGRQLSKKYGVSTVTIRWYIKALKGNSASPVARSQSSIRLLDIVKNVSAEGLARALAAKKLFIQLQEKLAETEQLRRSLEAATARARELEKRLQRLTSR